MVVHNVRVVWEIQGGRIQCKERVVWETQGGRTQCKGGMGDSGWSYTIGEGGMADSGWSYTM